MAIVLGNATINLNVSINSAQAGDLNSTQRDNLTFERSYSFTQGTGANQSERAWYDSRTISSASSEDIDLADLTDQTGQAITFTKIKLVIVHNTHATSTKAITVDTTNPTFPWNEWLNGIVTVKGGYNASTTAGGLLVLGLQDALGFTVTDNNKNVIRIGNAGSSDITYEIIILGNIT